MSMEEADMACTCSSNSLSCCGCCGGLAQQTPQTIDNRPGLSALAYRVGTYAQFNDTLLARIASSRQPSLAGLRTRDPNDFTIALLDAFSVMADVLTFYSERIANEAYLRTATERMSIRELANLVGYRMSPGVAAVAYLAFTIDPSAGAFGTALTAPVNAQVVPEPAPSIVVPAGTRVQSIPGPGEKPQAFETIEQINVRPEWNAMSPRLSQPQQVGQSATAIILSGTASNLKNGDRLLILPGDDPANATVTTVLSVNPAADGKTTEVDLQGWAPPPPQRYTPSTFTDIPAGSLTRGSLADLQAVADIPTAAALLAGPNFANWWDAGDIVAAAQANQWPLDELTATIDQLVAAQNAAAGGSIYVFRQSAAPFGYNAPNYYSLPPALRFPTLFEATFPTSPTTVWEQIPAAYPTPWDPDSTGAGGFTLDQWGKDSSGNYYLYLDSPYSQIVPGSYVWLAADSQSSGPLPSPQAAAVVTNSTVNHGQFSASGKVSQLTVRPAGGTLGAFPLRTTAILCQSEALPLAEVPIGDPLDVTQSAGVIALDGAYLGLLAGQSVILSGQTIVNGVPGPVAAEVCTLQQVQLVNGFTIITLAKSLSNVYQRFTVKINANVAEATHGQTITELLGSGDGTQTFQAFTLHQSPLTYIPAAGTTGAASTLEVYVDGVLWTEVPFFYGHGPGERVYVTAQDDAGVTTLTFGDGITGSRLPTGTANVKATYRYGIGVQGMVRANQLSQFLSRPLGVRGVNNPLPAAGGADAEDLDSGRGRATLAIMTLDRVVSVQDYQDFAKAYVGISKALATWTWDGQQRVLVLTIAGANGPIADDDPVLTNLPAAIGARSEPGVSLALFPYSATYFTLSATVIAAADRQIADVQAAVETVLRADFGFAARDFGQPVYQSEVVAVIQDVDGVVDVTVSLYASDDLSTPLTQIAAAVPQTGGRNAIFPAQLLTLDPGPLDIKVTQ
jgi:hypothetical protein